MTQQASQSLCSEDLARCLAIAASTQVFGPADMEVLKEVLACSGLAAGAYCFFSERDENSNIIGFIIFGRTPITSFSWDIYWLVIEQQYQGKGYGKRLLARVEEYVMSHTNPAILRIETSSFAHYAHARNLYTKSGYQAVGSIKNFYESNNDLVIYCKYLGS